MSDRTPSPPQSSKDRLVTRPDEPLPTTQDPQVHGHPADPKPKPKGGQGNDPHAGDLDHSV
jgi:hypothetical protein